jgi:hypothetical protein
VLAVKFALFFSKAVCLLSALRYIFSALNAAGGCKVSVVVYVVVVVVVIVVDVGVA